MALNNDKRKMYLAFVCGRGKHLIVFVPGFAGFQNSRTNHNVTL